MVGSFHVRREAPLRVLRKVSACVDDRHLKIMAEFDLGEPNFEVLRKVSACDDDRHFSKNFETWLAPGNVRRKCAQELFVGIVRRLLHLVVPPNSNSTPHVLFAVVLHGLPQVLTELRTWMCSAL